MLAFAVKPGVASASVTKERARTCDPGRGAGTGARRVWRPETREPLEFRRSSFYLFL